MLAALTELSTKDLLSLSVLGSMITAVGTLIGLAVKEYFFARSFERWKSRLVVEALFQKYRDPILLAVDELSIRVKEVCSGYGAEYLSSNLLKKMPTRMTTMWADDPYYQRYKLESTFYRLCALFGWFELYRQEVVFLRSSKAKHNRKLEAAIDAIRDVIADGQINVDGVDSKDRLIFREEQRAIGAMMITSAGATRTIMGYGEFSELLREKVPSHQYRWIRVASDYLLDFSPDPPTFRVIRMKALYVHLVNLIAALDSSRIRASHREAREKFSSELPAYMLERISLSEKAARTKRIFERRQPLK
jgi:hypothetical protein